MSDGRLGVLSVHLDGAPCAVGCPFCYLGARERPQTTAGLRLPVLRSSDATLALLVRAVEELPYEELAIAVSEPVPHADVGRLVAAARARGMPIAITTTTEVVAAHPNLLDGVSRLNLSVDPWKLGDDPGQIEAHVARVCQAVKGARPTIEIIAIATVSTPGFAKALVRGGLLEALVDQPALDGVALSALKPPPPFCDRAFWLDTLRVLRPLLDRALERRLHLDCYVAARLLGIGGCPARPDLSPAGDGRISFRACVYAPRADAVCGDLAALEAEIADFVAPAVCPFDTRL